jgi:hypothetical protein
MTEAVLIVACYLSRLLLVLTSILLVVVPSTADMLCHVRYTLVVPCRLEQYKWRAVVTEIKRIHKEGRPVLVGTTSVEKSELLSEMLAQEGIKHQVWHSAGRRPALFALPWLGGEHAHVCRAGMHSCVCCATGCMLILLCCCCCCIPCRC